MRYFQFDRTINTNNSHYKLIKISLLTISLIIIISSIIYSYYLNNSNLNNTRRKIDKIEGDITILYNYTETMSDFIVDNYKPPEINLKLILEELKNETNNKYLELKKELNELKVENKELKNLINKNENITKLYLRKLAFDYIGRLSWSHWFHINYYNNPTYDLYYEQYLYDRDYYDKLYIYHFHLFASLSKLHHHIHIYLSINVLKLNNYKMDIFHFHMLLQF